MRGCKDFVLPIGQKCHVFLVQGLALVCKNYVESCGCEAMQTASGESDLETDGESIMRPSSFYSGAKGMAIRLQCSSLGSTSGQCVDGIGFRRQQARLRTARLFQLPSASRQERLLRARVSYSRLVEEIGIGEPHRRKQGSTVNAAQNAAKAKNMTKLNEETAEAVNARSVRGKTNSRRSQASSEQGYVLP